MARREVCGSFGLDISSEFLWEPLSTQWQLKVSKVPHTGWVRVSHCLIAVPLCHRLVFFKSQITIRLLTANTCKWDDQRFN